MDNAACQITYSPALLSQQELELFFSKDDALLNKWHIVAPASAVVCAARTYTDLLTAEGYTYYQLFKGAEKIGYFGLQRLEPDTRALTGFFLSPPYRTPEVASALWDIIANEFDGLPFLCGVYAKNEAAVSFLKKKSTAFTTIEAKDGPVSLFTINGASN